MIPPEKLESFNSLELLRDASSLVKRTSKEIFEMEMNLGSVTILVDSPEKLSFKLTGKVGSWQDEQDGPDWFAGKYMEEKFEAATISEAIQKARSLVAEFLEKNEELCPPHLYKERACTFDFSLSQVVWEYEFTKKKPGRRATEGVPEVPEHITERYKRF